MVKTSHFSCQRSLATCDVGLILQAISLTSKIGKGFPKIVMANGLEGNKMTETREDSGTDITDVISRLLVLKT